MSNPHRSWLALELLVTLLLVGACGGTQSDALQHGDATQGRSVWAQSTCVGCHGVNGEGSRAGPALAYTPLTIREFNSIVRRGGPGMPKYPATQIRDQDLRDMYAWFQSPLSAATVTPALDPWTQSPCVGCHGIRALGGSGPSLAGTGQPFAAFQTVVRQGAEGMPSYGSGQISDADLRSLYDWLQAQIPAQAEVPATEGNPWVQAGCGACHGASAEGGIATDLTGGEYAYDEFQRVVRQGADGMPSYGTGQISDADLRRLYDWVQAQTPPQAEVPATKENPWVQAGCGACHGESAEGGAATALTGGQYAYDEFQRVVREGADGMPSYSASQISDADLQRMYDWLQAQTPPQAEVPATEENPWVQAGCGACHGESAEGGIATALTGGDYAYDEFQRVVREGADGMPSYSASQISDADLQRMYDWVMALP